MQIDNTIKNYRCCSKEHPVKLTLKPRILALVGVNNSGKSSVLKIFYEVRLMFMKLNESVAAMQYLHKGDQLDYSLAAEVRDPWELFFNGNSQPIEIDITLPEFHQHEDPAAAHPVEPTVVNKVIITLNRDSKRFAARFQKSNKEFDPDTARNI